MGEVLLAALVVALLVGVALALLAALTVLPFVLALQTADRRDVSGRVGALSLAGSGAGLAAAAFLALRTSTPLAVAVLPLVGAGVGPLAAAVTPRRWLGRRGGHEPSAGADQRPAVGQGESVVERGAAGE